jgi:hypothetical protein
MIRKLTDEEIAKSRAAAKNANRVLSQRRKELFEQVAKLRRVSSTPPYERIARLLDERDAIRNVHGLPVRLTIDGEELIINYEFLQKFLRKLARSRWTIDITVSDTGCLQVAYERPPNYGKLELRGLPRYQTVLLEDLPRVEIVR